MRMRLRAPDEPETESGNDLSENNSTTRSTSESRPLLPPLDVGSPEYIEERLENLKRRPKWRDYLDQYVQENPDSDSEDEGGDEAMISDPPGLILSTIWSLLFAAFAPLLILCALFLKHKSYGFWPLGCHSMSEFVGCALVNVIFLFFGLVMLYWTICRELPDVYSVENSLIKINAQINEVQCAVTTCHAALLQWERKAAQELCVSVGIDAVLLLLNVWLLLHYYCRWARGLMILLAAMFLVDVPALLYDVAFPAPEISQVDPTFAMVDEELLVALDGVNLKSGGSVAWVSYWGCASISNVDACDKQFVSTFEAGIVAVTFRSLDHFIPCYRDPPNPHKAQDFQCFKDVRIRVKDTYSIPGWSRSVSQAFKSRSVKAEPSLRNLGKINVTTFVYRQEKVIGYEMMKSTENKATTIEPTESFQNDVTGGMKSALGIGKDVRSNEGMKSTPEIDYLARIEVKGGPKTAKIEANGKSEEIQLMTDTEVKMLHVDIEVGTASQSSVTEDPVESLHEQESKIDEFLNVLKEVLVDVEIDKKEAQKAAMGPDKDGKLGLTNDAIQSVSDALANEKVEVISIAVILEKEHVQMADRIQDGPELKRNIEINMKDARLEESAVITQNEKLRNSGIKQETSHVYHVSKVRSKPRDAAVDNSKKEETSEKKRTSTRKEIRSMKKTATEDA